MSRRGVSAPLAVQMESLKKSMSSRDQRRNQERMQRVVRSKHYPRMLLLASATVYHTTLQQLTKRTPIRRSRLVWTSMTRSSSRAMLQEVFSWDQSLQPSLQCNEQLLWQAPP